jgi:hypothetical protein
MLHAFSSDPFYATYIWLPCASDPTPPEIVHSPKFFPYFNSVIGAIDGTHITYSPSVADRLATWNHKGGFSQNCLMACDFNMKFIYVLSGWEGSAADAAIYYNACLHNLYIPCGKFYLADAGFSACDELLIPYCGVHYHLAEFKWGNER